MLLRIVRTNSIYEEATVEQAIVAGFSTADGEPDLELSVYEIDEEHLVQAHSEHSASLLDPKPRSRIHLDLNGLGIPEDPSDSLDLKFKFIRERHKVIKLESRQALMDLVSKALSDTDRRRTVSSEQSTEYILNRIAAKDPEWVSACESGKWQAWASKATSARAEADRPRGR